MSDNAKLDSQNLININNDVLYCAIGIALLLDISLRQCIDAIRDSADAYDGASIEPDEYMSQLRSGQILPILLLAAGVAPSPWDQGKLAVQSENLGLAFNQFRRSREEMFTNLSSEEKRLGLEICDDARAQTIFMCMHAFSYSLRMSLTGLYSDEFSLETIRESKVPAFARQSLQDLGEACSDNDFMKSMKNAENFLILQDPLNWASSYNPYNYWSNRLPIMAE